MEQLMDVEPFQSPVEATPSAVTPCRRRFSAWLRECDVDEDLVAELTIVFSELLSNAVKASRGAEREVRTRADLERGRVVIEVCNPVADTRGAVDRWDLGDPLRAGGRGLVIVRAYTDDVEIELRDDSLVVRCSRRMS
jgi:anti-sigma regulatory factor (Ser/Thr protein kinase)